MCVHPDAGSSIKEVPLSLFFQQHQNFYKPTIRRFLHCVRTFPGPMRRLGFLGVKAAGLCDAPSLAKDALHLDESSRSILFRDRWAKRPIGELPLG
jgi:hypothetical protein